MENKKEKEKESLETPVQKTKNKKMTDGFNTAVEGIFDAIRTEKHMKFHTFITVVILILLMFIDVTKFELIAILFCIALIWFAELMNTAIECCIDLACKDIHPIAKKGKDSAAGAVLIMCVNAFVIGYIILGKKLSFKLQYIYAIVQSSTHQQFFLIAVIVLASVFLLKMILKKGTPLKGGMPSGHSALGGAVFVTINYINKDAKVFYLSLIMLVLILQSRVEGKIHSVFETVIGACVGGVIAYLILLFFNL